MSDQKSKSITSAEMQEAQRVWGEGVVRIGKIYKDDEDYVAEAEKHVEKMYAYGVGPVLFKPTKAAEVQFRNTPEGAVSYFVGGNDDYSEDHGFALQPWIKVEFEDVEFVEGQQALAMGNYYFTTEAGERVKVEFSFGYVRDEQGNLRINLHHSSLPYTPEH